MSEQTDPILDALLEKAGDLFGSKKAEYDDPYGLGTHKGAVVTEIERIGFTPFGARVGVKFNLNGEGMPYTARLDLPEELKSNGEEPAAYLVKRQEQRAKIINQLLNHIKKDLSLEKTITTEEDYQRFCNLLESLVGKTVGLRIVADGKNQKGANDKWEFIPNGYTKVAEFLRPKKTK